MPNKQPRKPLVNANLPDKRKPARPNSRTRRVTDTQSDTEVAQPKTQKRRLEGTENPPRKKKPDENKPKNPKAKKNETKTTVPPAKAAGTVPKQHKGTAVAASEARQETAGPSVARVPGGPKVRIPAQKIAKNHVQGVLFSCGCGDTGQLGLGLDHLEVNKFRKLSLNKQFRSVKAGAMHTVCLTSLGQVVTFGCNDEGALGRVTVEEEESFEPGDVILPEPITRITAGGSHSCALTESGKVFVWGNFRDISGPMGLNPKTAPNPVLEPYAILPGVKIIEITSGENHLVCLDDKGTLYTMGNCSSGQLGRISIYGLDNRGGRRGLGTLLTPMPVRSLKSKPYDKIWAGTFSTFARVKESGDIYGFGNNIKRQLSPSSLDTILQPELLHGFKGRRWAKICSTENHTLALTEDGKVFSFGSNLYGRLGHRKQGKGENGIPEIVDILQSKVCIDIGCAGSVSYAVTENGSLYSWGSAVNNVLGHDSDDDFQEPTRVSHHSGTEVLTVSAGGQHTVLLAVGTV